MSVLQAILLGIVQGITEFLPVSSFGHLAAIENAMGITRNTAVLFEVLLHIGTMVAVFFAFHEDLRRIGEELLCMIMDIIGNVNIYFHNRKPVRISTMPEWCTEHTVNLQRLWLYHLFPQHCLDTFAEDW